MADFSKEYVEKYMQEWSSDFSIIDEFEKLEEGYYIGQICEGYGFIGITKQDNKLKLIFTKEDDEDKIELIDYNQLDEYSRKRFKTC